MWRRNSRINNTHTAFRLHYYQNNVYQWHIKCVCLNYFRKPTRNMCVIFSYFFQYWDSARTCTSCKINKPVAQIPQCTSPISHNAPFYNRNVHICAHFCYKIIHSGLSDALWDLWDWSIAWFQKTLWRQWLWHESNNAVVVFPSYIFRLQQQKIYCISPLTKMATTFQIIRRFQSFCINTIVTLVLNRHHTT